MQFEVESVDGGEEFQTYFFHFPWSWQCTVKAVEGIDFVLREGDTLGMVGESGCGTTMARLGLERTTGGSLRLRGQEMATLTGPAWGDY